VGPPMSELRNKLKEGVLKVPEYLNLINDLISPIQTNVIGEITDLKISRDWVFFSLKDKEEPGVLRCGLHASQYRKIGVQIEEGMEVRILGYGKLAKKSGNFGFWVQEIEPVGEGALKKAYELLLQKLKEEGLYEKHRPLPSFVQKIGIISSLNGVVVHDFMNNLKKLNYKIEFTHSAVEGLESANELVKAIKHFNNKKEKPEVLAIIRGGGSLESLQGFNNEQVVREIFASKIPTVVGIGHDVDVPIATLVADHSASTPTGVAHIINSTWDTLFEELPRLEQGILSSLEHGLERKKDKARLFFRTMESNIKAVVYRFDKYSQNLDSLKEAINYRIQSVKEKIKSFEKMVELSSPERNLKLGYSIVSNEKGKIVRSKKDVEMGDVLKTKVLDGEIESKVTNK